MCYCHETVTALAHLPHAYPHAAHPRGAGRSGGLSAAAHRRHHQSQHSRRLRKRHLHGTAQRRPGGDRRVLSLRPRRPGKAGSGTIREQLAGLPGQSRKGTHQHHGPRRSGIGRPAKSCRRATGNWAIRSSRSRPTTRTAGGFTAARASRGRSWSVTRTSKTPRLGFSA